MIAEKYKLITPLGKGRYATVWLAIDTALQREKAIKILNASNSDEYIHDCLEEARTLNKCEHKHIVKINEAHKHVEGDSKTVIIDMEYIKKGSLEQFMKKEFLTCCSAIQHTCDILFGLEHAHNLGIVHKDIKPGNIMLGINHAKLSDFGLAARKDKNHSTYFSHLAPEYFTQKVQNVQTDIFAVGITLYRLLANVTDWKKSKSTVRNLDAKVKSGKLLKYLEWPPYVPLKIKRLVLKASNPNLTLRYANASAMRRGLESLKFSIDWKKIGKMSWVGRDITKDDEWSIDCEAKQFIRVIVKKNRRRVASHCATFPNIKKADEYISNHVAQTILVT